MKGILKSAWWYAASFIFGALIMLGIGALLLNIQQRKDEALTRPMQLAPIPAGTLDVAVWGRNYPREYDRFLMMVDQSVETKYGGSKSHDKLEADPRLKDFYAGYAFAAEYNSPRSHWYALQDQKDTQRTHDPFKQPGACANCHAGETPALIKQMGWEQFNHTPYNDLRDQLHTSSTCADCHDPDSMALTLTRPALINALQAQGIDWTKATRQQMRSYVCMQCHVEYYFAGDNKVLTFPWNNGMTIDGIEKYYTDINFKDWAHKITGAPMLKMQHPESEMYSTSVHAANGVACADCHMPYIREGAVKISDHWVRSPLTNVENACQGCHNIPAKQLEDRVTSIQDRHKNLLERTEVALEEAINAIKAAKDAGGTDEQLKDVYNLQRRAQMRWDFVSSENSMGFHSPQEAARILGESIDFSRQAQLAAERVTVSLKK